MKPSKGLRFYHSRVLDTVKWDGKTRQLYQVTAMRQGYVYYRPVYDYGTRTELGKPDCCPVASFTQYYNESEN